MLTAPVREPIERPHAIISRQMMLCILSGAILSAVITRRLIPEVVALVADVGVGLPASTTAIIRAAYLTQFVAIPALIGFCAVLVAIGIRAVARPLLRSIEAALLISFAASVAIVVGAVLQLAGALGGS
jgi:hypothetical protein